MLKSEFRQNYYRTSFLPTVPPFAARISRVVVDRGTWRLKWEHLKAGESNGKLPPRTCPGCSVPEAYRSHDWALVPAKPGLQGWILMNDEYAKKRVSIQCAPLRIHVEISSPTCQAKFIPYSLGVDSVSCWSGPVLLTVVTPPNSYYTQQEWHTSKFFNSFHYSPFYYILLYMLMAYLTLRSVSHTTRHKMVD